MRRASVPLLLLLAAAGVAIPSGSDDPARGNWPQWRGPTDNGVAPLGDPPIEWSETKHVRWKVRLPGTGHSTPVVWGDRIYVQSAARIEQPAAPPEEPARSGAIPGTMRTDAAIPASNAPAPPAAEAPPPGERRGRGPRPAPEPPTEVHAYIVSALDRASGATVWETVVRKEIPHEAGHSTASPASPSPVTDGKHVWAFFGSRGLYCLDRDGKVRWEKDLGDMQTRNAFGEGASPALHGDTIVVNWDHEGDSFVVALDKLTGEERWRAARDEPTSWSTPLVVRDGERTLVVVSATNRVRAYDLRDGAVAWEVGGLGVNCIPTPVTDGATLFVMSGYRDPAGLAIRYAGAKGDLTGSDAVAWRIERGLSYVPSPLLYDGTLYFVDRFSAVLGAYDLRTGKVHYAEQRLEGLSNVYASPVGAAGRVYVLDRDGTTAVLRHAPSFELLATNELDDAFDASPVVVGKELFLRGHSHLYCIAEPAAKPS